MKKAVTLLSILISVGYVYACSPAPGMLEAEFIPVEQRAAMISEYKEKIYSPTNLFESPAPTWTVQVPKYKMIKESGLYTLFISDGGACLSRGLYVKNWLILIMVGITSAIIFFVLRASTMFLSVKRNISILKSFLYLVPFLTLFLLIISPRYFINLLLFNQKIIQLGYGYFLGGILYSSIITLLFVLTLKNKSVAAGTTTGDSHPSSIKKVLLYTIIGILLFPFLMRLVLF